MFPKDRLIVLLFSTVIVYSIVLIVEDRTIIKLLSKQEVVTDTFLAGRKSFPKQ
jgi:hypothetical protein